MKYECFIQPEYRSGEIEADNAEDARKQFCDLVRENLETRHIEVSNLDNDDGEDPPKVGS